MCQWICAAQLSLWSSLHSTEALNFGAFVARTLNERNDCFGRNKTNERISGAGLSLFARRLARFRFAHGAHKAAEQISIGCDGATERKGKARRRLRGLCLGAISKRGKWAKRGANGQRCRSLEWPSSLGFRLAESGSLPLARELIQSLRGATFCRLRLVQVRSRCCLICASERASVRLPPEAPLRSVPLSDRLAIAISATERANERAAKSFKVAEINSELDTAFIGCIVSASERASALDCNTISSRVLRKEPSLSATLTGR